MVSKWNICCFLVLLVPSVFSQCLTNDDSSMTQDVDAAAGIHQSLIQGQMDFGLDLFKKLMVVKSEKNSFYSPESVSQALKMAFFGAAGETEQEIRDVMGFQNISKVEVMKEFRLQNLWRHLRAQDNNYTLEVTNRLYFDQSVEIRQCIQELFEKEIRPVDFQNKSEEIRLEINSWVEEHTHGKIKNLVPKGDVNSGTLLALVNSAYFKGTWLRQFKPAQTKVQTFYKDESNFSHVKMMHAKTECLYSASEELEASVLQLPYEDKNNNSDISMILILPPFKNNSLDETVARLNSTNLLLAIESAFPLQVEIGLPKFRIEQEFQLRDVLTEMGVGSMFIENAANFSEFTSTHNIHFGSAIHKAFVEVDEKGSEAAAATALVGFRSARPLSPLKFVCDHPFIFLIYDHKAANILFIGAIKDPKGLSM